MNSSTAYGAGNLLIRYKWLFQYEMLYDTLLPRQKGIEPYMP